jgi:hypothetical protein
VQFGAKVLESATQIPDTAFRKIDPKTCPHNNVQQYTEYCFDCGMNIYGSIPVTEPHRESISVDWHDSSDIPPA